MICPNCRKSLWFVRDHCPFCKNQLVAPPRPTSVTVISWLAIVSGLGSAFVVLSPAARDVMAKTSMLTHLLTFASIGLQTISGAVMLRGFNWARWAFVMTVAYNQLSKIFAVHWIPSPANILGPVLVATAYYYLFRPAANAYFSEAARPIGEPGASPKVSAGNRLPNSGIGAGPPSVS